MSQNGLDILGFLIDRLASDFRPYLNTVLGSVVDRWGVVWCTMLCSMVYYTL